MVTELEALTAYGQELVTDLRARVKAFPVTRFGPVNASGRLAASLRAEVTTTANGFRLVLYAESYALELEYGRKPGHFPLLLAIREWIVAKGIVPHPDARGRAVSVNSLAFLIGRKIAAGGTELYRAGQPSGLFGAVLAPTQVTAALKARLTPLLLRQVASALLDPAPGVPAPV